MIQLSTALTSPDLLTNNTAECDDTFICITVAVEMSAVLL